MATVVKREWTAPDGTKGAHFRVAYTDRDGKRKTKAFKAKKDADRYRVKIEGELAAGIHLADAQALTVNAVCKLFLAHTEDRHRDGRIGRARFEMLKLVLAKSIMPRLGARKLKDLTVPDVEGLYRHMIGAGKLSPRTARERVYILKQVEDFAMKRGMLRVGVASLASQEMRGIEKKPIKTFKLDDMGQLLRAVEVRKWRGQERSHAMLRCAVHLAAFCGLRRGEIFGLTLDNVDLDDRILHIRHNLTNWDVLKSTKTRAGIRDETIPPHVANLLRLWIDEHYMPNERRLLFRTHLRSGFMTQANWHNIYWRPLLRSAGLWQDDGDQLHFHALRHFRTSWMAHNGVPATVIAESMGHSSFDMTLQVYAHTLVPVRGRRGQMDDLSNKLLGFAAGPVIDATPVRESGKSVEKAAA